MEHTTTSNGDSESDECNTASVCFDSDSSSDDSFKRSWQHDSSEEINPYALEPLADPTQSPQHQEEIINNDEQHRLGNTDWCTCHNCVVMDTVGESGCCQEQHKVFDKMEEFASENNTELKCITDHPGFPSVCLDPWSLEMAYMYYKVDGYVDPADPLPEKYRYTGYRRFVQWIYNRLGKSKECQFPHV